MIGCLTFILTVDRVEDDVVVLEVGAGTIDVSGLGGVREGDRFVLCPVASSATLVSSPTPTPSPTAAIGSPRQPTL